jgi:hypothetical protein
MLLALAAATLAAKATAVKAPRDNLTMLKSGRWSRVCQDSAIFIGGRARFNVKKTRTL